MSIKLDKLNFSTHGVSHFRFETVNKRYRWASIFLRLGLVIGCTWIDWQLGLGALLMGAASLIEYAVQKEPWKPKEPRYNFVPGIGAEEYEEPE